MKLFQCTSDKYKEEKSNYKGGCSQNELYNDYHFVMIKKKIRVNIV